MKTRVTRMSWNGEGEITYVQGGGLRTHPETLIKFLILRRFHYDTLRTPI